MGNCANELVNMFMGLTNNDLNRARLIALTWLPGSLA
jgi:hypothetical protein